MESLGEQDVGTLPYLFSPDEGSCSVFQPETGLTIGRVVLPSKLVDERYQVQSQSLFST